MLVGVVFAALSGIACIHFLIRFIERIGLLPFTVYRLILAGRDRLALRLSRDPRRRSCADRLDAGRAHALRDDRARVAGQHLGVEPDGRRRGPRRVAAGRPAGRGCAPQLGPRPRASASQASRKRSKRSGRRNASVRSSSSSTVAGRCSATRCARRDGARPGSPVRGARSGSAAGRASCSISRAPASSWPKWRGHGVARRERPCRRRAPARQSAPPFRARVRAATSSTCSVCTPVSISGCHFSGCGTPYERRDLREHRRERAAGAQHLEVDVRALLAERALGLDPDALRHQRGHLAGRDDAAHQLHRLGRDREAERREASGEARHAQHAQRILDEGRRDVAQQRAPRGRVGRRMGR